jgi:serine/threonine protein phosphatase PrpC
MSAPPLPGEPPALMLTAAALSHPGRQRAENEDAYGNFADARLFVVADGMGGHNAGEVASAMAVDVIETFFRSFHSEPQQAWPYPLDRSLSLAANLLRNGIKLANDKIRESAAADRSRTRMGTTVVAVAIGEERLAVAHAGDSRAYRFRAGNLKQLTRDHSVAEEMRAARPEMSEEELATFAHRNVVTRALGSKEELEPAIYVGRVQPGDLFLLCTDGLWGVVPDGKIATILRDAADLQTGCQLLVDAANEAGGPDNITVLLVRAG